MEKDFSELIEYLDEKFQKVVTKEDLNKVSILVVSNKEDIKEIKQEVLSLKESVQSLTIS